MHSPGATGNSPSWTDEPSSFGQASGSSAVSGTVLSPVGAVSTTSVVSVTSAGMLSSEVESLSLDVTAHTMSTRMPTRRGMPTPSWSPRRFTFC